MSSEPIDLDIHNEEDSVGDLHTNVGDSSQGDALGSSKRKRPLKSKWWQYFDMLPKKEGEDLRCKCKACGITYKADSSMGTEIVDPRFKMQFVEFCYNKLYGHGSNELNIVKLKLVSLFEEYMCNACKSSTSNASSSSHGEIGGVVPLRLSSSECLDVFKEFDNFQSLELSGRTQKSQLDLYLDESKFDRFAKIDVLDFWKAHQFRYPELAQMAKDILSVPISTVASESAFSTGGRILDQYRSAMKPEVVEALVCCRDWLFGHKETNLELDDLIENIMNSNGQEDAGSSNVVADDSNIVIDI